MVANQQMSFEELLLFCKRVAFSQTKEKNIPVFKMFEPADFDKAAQSLAQDPVVAVILAEYSAYFQSYQKVADELAETKKLSVNVHAQSYHSRRSQAACWLKTRYPHPYITQEQQQNAVSLLLEEIEHLLADPEHQQSLLCQERQRNAEFQKLIEPAKIEEIVIDFKKYLQALAKEFPNQSFSIEWLLCLRVWIDQAPNGGTRKTRWGALLETFDEGRTAHFMTGSYNNKIYTCPEGLEQRLFDRAYFIMLSEDPNFAICDAHKLAECLINPYIQKNPHEEYLTPTNALYQCYLKSEGLKVVPRLKIAYKLQPQQVDFVLAEYINQTHKTQKDFFEKLELINLEGFLSVGVEDRVFFEKYLLPQDENGFVLCHEATGALFDGDFDKAPEHVIKEMSEAFLFGYEHLTILLSLLGQYSCDLSIISLQNQGLDVLRQYAIAGKGSIGDELFIPPHFSEKESYDAYDSYLQKLTSDPTVPFYISFFLQGYHNAEVFQKIDYQILNYLDKGIPTRNSFITRWCQEEKLSDSCADLLVHYLKIKKSDDLFSTQQDIITEHAEIIKVLLSRGAAQELIDRHAQNAMLIAVENSWPVSMIEMLLEHSKKYELAKRVSLESQDKYGRTALLIACQKGNIALVKYLLKEGASLAISDNNKNNPLSLAVLHSHKQIGLLLLNAQTPENLLDLHSANNDGETSLMLAAAAGYLDIVQKILNLGVNPWALNYMYQTALYQAAYHHQTKVCLLFLQPDYQPSFWQRVSLFFDYLKIGKIFLEHPAAATAGNFSTWERGTVWESCLMHDDKELAQEIIKYQIPLPTRRENVHIIMQAILNDSYDVLELLLKTYPELIEKTDSQGQTAIHYAAAQNSSMPMKVLLENGANPFVKNHKRENILHHVCRVGQSSNLIEILKRNNTNILLNEYNFEGKTPIAIALEQEQPEFLAALLPYKNNPEFYKEYLAQFIEKENFDLCHVFLRAGGFFTTDMLKSLIEKAIRSRQKRFILKLLEAGVDFKLYASELLNMEFRGNSYDEEFLNKIFEYGVLSEHDVFKNAPKISGDDFISIFRAYVEQEKLKQGTNLFEQFLESFQERVLFSTKVENDSQRLSLSKNT